MDRTCGTYSDLTVRLLVCRPFLASSVLAMQISGSFLAIPRTHGIPVTLASQNPLLGGGAEAVKTRVRSVPGQS